MHEVLAAWGLRKVYRRGTAPPVVALYGASLAVWPGEMVAIMGPSGSGKSTLLHLLGLLHTPDRDGGPPPSLRIAGRETVGLADDERTRLRARALGFVFQSFDLLPTLDARENVALAATCAGRSRDEAHQAAGWALAAVGLSGRLRHYPDELSGGEQQRVAIARAIINRPALLLADEPTGNLDRARAAETLALLQRANAAGQAIVIVTHDPGIAATCGRVITMCDGHIVAVHQRPTRGWAVPGRRP